MNGRELIEKIRQGLEKREGKKVTNKQLVEHLGVKLHRLQYLQNRESVTSSQIAKLLLEVQENNNISGEKLVEVLRAKLEKESDKKITNEQISDYLGNQSLQYFRNKKIVETHQVVRLLFKSRYQAVAQAEEEAIQTIVEFFRIDPAKSQGGKKSEIFEVGDNPYRQGLREELEKHRGIYIFYDSSGRALYTGQTEEQTLWKEINNVFNRYRSVQQIRRVKHPHTHHKFRTSNEKRRQIRPLTVPLSDLASYVSAYQITGGLIKDLEALLIRAFPNNLLNKQMENFGRIKLPKKK